MAVTCHAILLIVLGLTVETVPAAPLVRGNNLEHRQSKRNFVPNRFDIIDNEIKHAIQKEVQNALRKNFVPNNPLLEDRKWGKSSPARYPENQPSMIYGMEYDEHNPSRSDPGYLVLDLKQLSQGRLKFHEQQMGGQKKTSKPKRRPAPSSQTQQQRQQNVQSPYYNQAYNYGQYSQYQPYNNAYQNYQQQQPQQQQQQRQQQQQQQQPQQQQQQQQSYNNINPVQAYPQNSHYAVQG